MPSYLRNYTIWNIRPSYAKPVIIPISHSPQDRSSQVTKLTYNAIWISNIYLSHYHERNLNPTSCVTQYQEFRFRLHTPPQKKSISDIRI